MNWRRRVLWVLSVMMLVWIGVMTANQRQGQACTDAGGRWSMFTWECTPARRILLQRDLYRT